MSVAAEQPVPDVRARGLSPLWACSAVAFLLVSLVVGVLAGPVDLGVGAVLESTAARFHVPGFSTSLSPTEEAILWEIRVPRVVLAALVGAMLALAGATYQGVFRNPLADPYLLGVAAGAGLGATIAIAYLPGRPARPAAAPGRRVRRRLDRGDADVRRRPLGAARARRRDARSSPASPSRRSSRPGRRSSSSRTRRRCRRCTRGSSGTSRARAGRTSF